MVLGGGIVAPRVELVGVLFLFDVSKSASCSPVAASVFLKLETHFGLRFSLDPLSPDLSCTRSFRTHGRGSSILTLGNTLAFLGSSVVSPPGHVDNWHQVRTRLSSFSRNDRGWVRPVTGPRGTRSTAVVSWGSLVVLRLPRIATGLSVVRVRGLTGAADGPPSNVARPLVVVGAVVAVKALVGGDIFC